MTFEPLPLHGAWLIRAAPGSDHRGWFGRVFCADEFATRGIDSAVLQTSLSYNRQRATLRGMHWQQAPHLEGKLVRCVRGSVYDVLLDVRPGSPTEGRWTSVELSDSGGAQVWVPPGVAHGFETLEDDTLVLYHMSGKFVPQASRRILWNDRRFRIEWPLPPAVLSEADSGMNRS
ncbi:MAG: dTDP-4-keto-6-deoxy-D-glucose epimerase [Acidobacteria bacterium]|nr:dTDP-4-keto-6-deoxy-D-glucose epimerase [Acidobacteriota bacterium]